MKTVEAKRSLTDYYYSILKNLNRNEKLDLISRLSESMKTDQNIKDDTSWKSLFGALELDESPEDFILKIENERNFNRDEIDL